MAKKLIIAINLTAGTKQFLTDMGETNSVIKQFGSNTKSSMAASSAVVREFEGNITNNTRAVTRFLSETLKLGPAMEAAFKIAGPVAVAGALYEATTRAAAWFETMKSAPQKISSMFGEATAAIRQSNDELRVTNDRLEGDINTLEGKRRNTLKLALDEAAASADKLAGSLEKDLSALYKLLHENKPDFFDDMLKPPTWEGFVHGLKGGWAAGAAGDAAEKQGKPDYWDISRYFGGETGYGGMKERVADIRQTNQQDTDRIRERADSVLAPKEKEQLEKAANDRMNEALLKEYQKGLDYLAEAMKHADDVKHRELVRAAQRNLTEEVASAREQIRNTGDVVKKGELTGDQENNRDRELPFEKRLSELDAKIAESRLQLAAVGKDSAFQTQAKAAGEALVAIDAINEALKRRHELDKAAPAALTATQEGQIKSRFTTLGGLQEETKWGEKIDDVTKKIYDQIHAQEQLTRAIGKGYEAVERAHIEVELTKYFSSEELNDPTQQPAIAKVRTQLSAADHATSGTRTTEATQALVEQIALERALAQVQAEGAEAIRLVTLQYKLREMAAKGASMVELIATVALAQQLRATASAADITKINERTEAVRRLAAAELQGAEAVRQAELENKRAELEKENKSPQEIDKALDEMREQRELEINKAAGDRLNLYKDQLDAIDKQEAVINRMMKTDENRLAIERSLRDLENERLKILVQMDLSSGSAMDGVKAFFTEMQESAKNAAQIIYEALNSALDKASDQLAKLVTGQKTSFAKMLQGVGEDMVRSSIKSGLQTGIGALGKLGGPPKGTVGYGPDGTPHDDQGNPIEQGKGGGIRGILGKLVGASKKDGQQESSALWVQIAKSTGKPGQKQGEKPSSPLVGGGGEKPDGSAANPFYVVVENEPKGGSGGAAAVVQSLFKPGSSSSLGGGGDSGAGAGESVSSSISYGDVVSGAGSAAEEGGGGIAEGVGDAAEIGAGFADGGYPSADKAYMVGERGPEIVKFGAGAQVVSNASSRRMLGGGSGSTHNYSIDARGTDPVQTEARVRAAILSAHDSAVANSVKSSNERLKRIPNRGGK